MTVPEYQNSVKELIEFKLNLEVNCEWRSQMNTNIYAPRLDIAVGPYSIEDGTNIGEEYDQIYDNINQFIYQLVKIHFINTNEITPNTTDDEIDILVNNKIQLLKDFNHNSRCFIAIEVEHKVSRKHLMGGAINAAVLGRIAIAVGFTEEKHRAFLNLHRYFAYLESVQKPTFHVNNLLIVSADQLLSLLDEL